jgi:hypothetical protein
VQFTVLKQCFWTLPHPEPFLGTNAPPGNSPHAVTPYPVWEWATTTVSLPSIYGEGQFSSRRSSFPSARGKLASLWKAPKKIVFFICGLDEIRGFLSRIMSWNFKVRLSLRRFHDERAVVAAKIHICAQTTQLACRDTISEYLEGRIGADSHNLSDNSCSYTFSFPPSTPFFYPPTLLFLFFYSVLFFYIVNFLFSCFILCLLTSHHPPLNPPHSYFYYYFVLCFVKGSPIRELYTLEYIWFFLG